MSGRSARRHLWELLEAVHDEDGKRPSLDWYDLLLSALIVLNVVAVVLESVQRIGTAYDPFFKAFETFSIAIFTLEYLARLWACTADRRYARPVTGRIRYALTFMALVDLAAFAPFYLPAIIPVDLRFLRTLRLFRLLRVFKLGRYSKSLRLLNCVFRAKTPDLAVAVMGLLVLLVLASSIMFFLENEAQPELFSSIPAAMWWAVATLTTVGYGDVYPVTEAGKILGAVISILGIGLFALPAGILASGFFEARQGPAAGPSGVVCPHCGRPIDGSSASGAGPAGEGSGGESR